MVDLGDHIRIHVDDSGKKDHAVKVSCKLSLYL